MYKNNNKKHSQFGKSSVLIPLAFNPGIGAYDWRFFDAPAYSQVWYSRLCGQGCCPLVGQLGGKLGEGFFFLLSLDLLDLLQVGALKWFHQMAGF
jgi:hypothetical protein